MILVLDASVVVDLLLRREPYYHQIKSRIRAADWLVAPHLLDAEVTQVFRRFVLRREISVQRANEAIVDLRDLSIERYPHAPFLTRAFDLRNNLTIYDALYVALAEGLDAELLTGDGGIAQTPGSRAAITVIE